MSTGVSLPSSKLKAQEDLRLERKHELEKYADERESRLRRERNQGYIKFAGYAALQLFLITLAFMAHKYIVNAGALLPIVCVAATSVPKHHLLPGCLRANRRLAVHAAG